MANNIDGRRRSSTRLSLTSGSSLSLTAPFTRDVFVAYADKDERVVNSRIIQPLESSGVTCCTAQRDFIGGQSETKSVVDFMETSRKTVVVLSENFRKYDLSHIVLGLSNQLIANGRVIPVRIEEDGDIDGRFRDVVILDMTAIDEATFTSRLEKAVTSTTRRSSGNIIMDNAAQSGLYTPEGAPLSEASSDSSTSSTDSAYIPQREWPVEDDDFPENIATMNAKEAVSYFNSLDSNDARYKHEERVQLRAVTTIANLHRLSHFSCSKSNVVADKALEKIRELVSSRLGHSIAGLDLDELLQAEATLRETVTKKGQSVIVKRRMLRLRIYALIVYQLGILLDKGEIDLGNEFFAGVSKFTKMDFKSYMNKGLIASYTVQFAQSAASYIQMIAKRKGSSPTHVGKMVRLVESQTEGTYQELEKSLCDTTTDKKKHFTTEVALHILTKKLMRVKEASTTFLDVLQKVLNAILKTKKMDKVCRGGLLLVGTQILVQIASNHANQGIRTQAVKGSNLNNMAGLCQLWEYKDKKWPEVEQEMLDLCTPLCFQCEDEAIIRATADRFLTDTTSSPQQITGEIPYQNDPPLDQTKMLPAMLKSIKRRLSTDGHILTVSDSQASTEDLRGSILYITGKMSDEDVLIKVTKHNTREDLVSKELSSDGLRNEIRVLRRIHHPHVIEVLASREGPSLPYYLITPRRQEGTLLDYVIGLRKAVPTDVIAMSADACRQVTEAVIFLSSKAKVVHRDIMAANILCRLPPNGRLDCCLTNFELSRTMKKSGSATRQAAKYECPGNPADPIAFRWSAPESLTQDIFTSATEVWMLACLIYEVLTLGVHPFPECEDPKRISDYLTTGGRTEQPPCLCKLDDKNRIYQFLERCWSADPANRPTVEAVRDFLDKTAKKHSKGDFSHVYVSPPTLKSEGIVRRSTNSVPTSNVPTDPLVIDQPLYYDPVAPDFPPGQPARPASPLSEEEGEYEDTLVPTRDHPYDDTVLQTRGYQELQGSRPYESLTPPRVQAAGNQGSRVTGRTMALPHLGNTANTASVEHLRQGARPRPYRVRARSEDEEPQPRRRLQTEPTKPNPRIPDPRDVQSEIFYI